MTFKTTLALAVESASAVYVTENAGNDRGNMKHDIKSIDGDRNYLNIDFGVGAEHERLSFVVDGDFNIEIDDLGIANVPAFIGKADSLGNGAVTLMPHTESIIQMRFESHMPMRAGHLQEPALKEDSSADGVAVNEEAAKKLSFETYNGASTGFSKRNYALHMYGGQELQPFVNGPHPGDSPEVVLLKQLDNYSDLEPGIGIWRDKERAEMIVLLKAYAHSKMVVTQKKLAQPSDADAKSGHQIIEEALAKAAQLDPNNSPFGMPRNEAVVYQQGLAAAYLHSLEMIPDPATSKDKT